VGPVKTQGPIFHIEGIKLGTYDRFIALAVKMLTKFGTVAYLRQESSVLDPATGGVVSAPIEEQAVQAMFVPNQWMASQTVYLFSQQMVQANDRQMIVAAPTYAFEPQPGDSISVDDGRAFDIVALIPIDPDGTVIAYKLLVRR